MSSAGFEWLVWINASPAVNFTCLWQIRKTVSQLQPLLGTQRCREGTTLIPKCQFHASTEAAQEEAVLSEEIYELGVMSEKQIAPSLVNRSNWT